MQKQLFNDVPYLIKQTKSPDRLHAHRQKQPWPARDIKNHSDRKQPFLYHGRVKAVSDGAREAGLDF